MSKMFLECSIQNCDKCITVAEFCAMQCNGTDTKRHEMCHKCEGQSLQAIPEEAASNCNLDDNSEGKDCISDSDENAISSSADVQLESSVERNLLETSSIDSFDDLLDYSASGSAKFDIDGMDAIEHNENVKMLMCQNCDIGFVLSDDLLSCIGE